MTEDKTKPKINSRLEWRNKKILVTGGSSFIGSHLVDALADLGAQVRIVDDLSSGKLENIARHLKNKRIEFIQADLRESSIARAAVKNINLIFHLAADHGGRGYVDLHQAGPAANLFLDGLLFYEAYHAGVEKIVFASSGCVYPNFLQRDINRKIFLSEDMVKPPYDSDNIYGYAKLMGELTLKAYVKEYGLKAASCRYFTVYGPRAVENHAIMAMIAKCFIGQDPLEIWGDGNQVRNWTFVEDIVRGTILAAEKIEDGSAINLGTMERIRVIDAVKEILRYTGHKARIKLLKDMPTGPQNRIADNSLAQKVLGWKPKFNFRKGLHKTIDWYFSTKNVKEIKKNLKLLLTERKL